MHENMEELVQMLSNGIEQVTQGVEMTNIAGNTLQEIVERSHTAAQRIRTITQKVSHQLNIATDVKSEVKSIAQLAHSNDDAVTQVVEFSQQLSQQMNHLQSIVDEFKTA